MRSKEEILKGRDFIEFYLNCKNNFKFFCEELLGVTEMGGIHPFQEEWVEIAEKNDLVVIEAPSGFSKTEIMGVCYPLWWMFKKNIKLEILLISKTTRQSTGILLQRIKDKINDNEILKDKFFNQESKNTINTQEKMKTSDGHFIANTPYNNSVKGFRSHMTVCDEADSYPETETYFKHVISRSHKGGKIILITTPEGTTKLINEIKELNKIQPSYYIHKTTAIIKPDGTYMTSKDVNTYEDLLEWGKKGAKCIWPEKFTYEQLINKWFDAGKWSWMQNYLCEIIGETEDALFPLKSIVSSYEYRDSFSTLCDKEAMYFIGADFAISDGPKADFDAYVVIELKDDMYRLKWMETHKGWQRPQKVQRLKELFQVFNQSIQGCRVVADESNMGTMVMNDLRTQGVTVIPQKFYAQARRDLLEVASNVFQGKGIIIPKNPIKKSESQLVDELQNQLCGFTRGKTQKGNETVFSKYNHDDLAIAFCMALKEASKQVNSYALGSYLK